MQVIIQHRKHACITESEKKKENGKKERKKEKNCDYDYNRKVAKREKEDAKE